LEQDHTSTLKVDSANNRVGIGTASPSKPLEVYNTTESTVWANTTTGIALLRAGGTGGDFYFGIDNSTGGGFGQGNYSRLIYSTGAYPIIFSSNASERYRIASDGVATWSNVGGVAGTAMTLNSTGLGVGASPTSKLTIGTGSFSTAASGTTGMYTTASGLEMLSDSYFFGSRSGNTLMLLTAAGNVGIGVTPSAWGSFFKSIESGAPSAYVIAASNVNGVQLASNCYNDNTNWLYKTTGTAARFAVNTSQFQWFIAPSGTAGNAITFTEAIEAGRHRTASLRPSRRRSFRC